MEFMGVYLRPRSRVCKGRSLLLQPAIAKGSFSLALAFVLACLTCPRARGDVGIVLNESLGVSVDRISGTGHSAVYFSRIWALSAARVLLTRAHHNRAV